MSSVIQSGWLRKWVGLLSPSVMAEPDRETVLRNLKADIEAISRYAPVHFPELKSLTPWRLAVYFRDVELAAWVKSQLLPKEAIYCVFLADK